MAVAYAWLVLLVSLLALCFLLSSSDPDARHHGWFGPEGPLRGWLVFLVALHLALCSFVLSSGSRCSASSPVWIRRTVARGVQENWIIWEIALVFFYGPLYLAVTCLSCSRLPFFPGDDFRSWFPYSALFLVQQRIHVLVSLRGYLETSHVFYWKVSLGSDPREGPDDLRRVTFAAFTAFFALRPHGRECPFFSPR